jgi:hypothetical protein
MHQILMMAGISQALGVDMAKPASLPRWADAGGDIQEPSSGKKDVGWTGERAKYQWMNWWMNLMYQWTSYLNTLESEALTWTGLQTIRKLVVQNNALSPSLIAREIDGNTNEFARFLIDHNGFPMGRFFARDIFWDFAGPNGDQDVTASADPLTVQSVVVPWRFGLTGTGRVRFQKAGEVAASLQNIGVGIANFNVPTGGRQTLSHRSYEIAAGWMQSDTSVFVMEFEVAFLTSLANANVRIGLLNRTLLTNPTIAQWDAGAHIGIRKNAADTNWQLTFGESGPTPDVVNLNVAPTIGTWQTIRLEVFFGTSNNSTCRVYVDGTLRTATGFAIRMPDASGGIDLVYPVITVEETGGASTLQLNVGPIRVRQNILQTSYEL